MSSRPESDEPSTEALIPSRRSSSPAESATVYGPGSVLAGKYRLDALLGEGAMGAVWQATNLLLDAPVAIKLTRAELPDEVFRERLQSEARAAAGFGHPAIVRIFDVGETEHGDPFIVMERLHGGTLSQMLSHERLPAVRAVQIVLPLVDALAAMHSSGVIHRDLKPDNIVVAVEHQRVQPKILDFGIAKRTGLCSGWLDDGRALFGTPEYMSPEQAAAREDIDYRTDIWSICVVLYEAIAGATPFRAPTIASLLLAIGADEPVPLVPLGLVDESLWSILRTGLSKNRDERHDSMSDLGRALARWLLDRGVHEDICGTALESVWFAGGEGALSASMNPAEHHVGVRDVERLLSARNAGPGRARSARRVVAGAVLGVVAAVAFAVTMKEKRPLETASSLRTGAVEFARAPLAAERMAYSPEVARDDAEWPSEPPQVSFAETRPPDRARALNLRSQAAVAGAQRDRLPQSVSARKAQSPTRSADDLGLIEPY